MGIKEVVWVDRETYSKIMNQLKNHKKCAIEAKGYAPMIVYTDIKVKKEIKDYEKEV